MKYSKEQLLEWYEQMLLIRRLEEKAAQMYGMQKIKGFLHLYIGQEAVAVGLESAIRKDDYVITAYREHGNAIARGIPPEQVMAELYGKITGCSKGKGGSMHMFSKEHNFLGGHGIVGAQIPLGAGVAFAIKYREEDKISVTMFGDGAARQGALHETFNMAMTWGLPVLFIVENNKYAMGTAVERVSNVTDIYKLACAYDMPAKQIDGMNVFSVYEGLQDVVKHVREKKSPYFVEIITYRYRGHSMSDPAKYRTKEELEKYKEKDPIFHLKHYLIEHEIATNEEISEIDKKVKETVKKAVEFAEKSEFPPAEELWKDVYVGDYPFIKED